MPDPQEKPDEKVDVNVADLIRQKAALLKTGDFFALLGVERTADPNAVRTAYFNLARLLHPDALARQNVQDLQREAIDAFKAISEAYHVLSDRRRRAEYEARTANAKPAATSERDAESEAKIFFHKGSLLLQRRAYAEAITYFRKAADLDAKVPKYVCYVGWAVMQNTDVPEARRLDEARGWFERAIEMGKGDADAHYFQSLYYKAVGETLKQNRALQDCLHINPNHVDAQREARLLAMRTKRNAPVSLFAPLQKAISKFLKKRR